MNSLITPNKLKYLVRLLESTLELNGDCAEVGVYKGGSAKALALAINGRKNFYLFDTFCGMPDNIDARDNRHKAGDFNNTSFEEVSGVLSGFPFVSIYKGMFPLENSEYVEDKLFSFVHLDVDIYNSYKDCLEFFYPKMVSGGIMAFDDYGHPSCKGATEAVNDFLEDKPEKIQLEKVAFIRKHKKTGEII